MSRLLGFRYEYKSCIVGKMITNYVILEKTNSELYLDYMINAKAARVNITDLEESFCNDLKEMHIEEWNNKEYEFPLHLCGILTSWELHITIDDMNVQCYGDDGKPKNWKEFLKLMNSIGIEKIM